MVDLFANGGTATLATATIWEMKPAILPVTWQWFTAARKGKSVDLQWKVSGEEENKFYSVERSGDGKKFVQIGVVASGSMNNGIYNYTDISPLPGKNYYRLRQVDNDGNFTFSFTRLVEISFPVKANFSFLKNNPAIGNFEIGIKKSARDVVLMVYDPAGKMLLQKRYSNLAENSVITIPAINLPAGIYTIVLNDGTHFETHKVLNR
jgi:hypothetical protein